MRNYDIANNNVSKFMDDRNNKHSQNKKVKY